MAPVSYDNRCQFVKSPRAQPRPTSHRQQPQGPGRPLKIIAFHSLTIGPIGT